MDSLRNGAALQRVRESRDAAAETTPVQENEHTDAMYGNDCKT